MVEEWLKKIPLIHPALIRFKHIYVHAHAFRFTLTATALLHTNMDAQLSLHVLYALVNTHAHLQSFCLSNSPLSFLYLIIYFCCVFHANVLNTPMSEHHSHVCLISLLLFHFSGLSCFLKRIRLSLLCTDPLPAKQPVGQTASCHSILSSHCHYHLNVSSDMMAEPAPNEDLLVYAHAHTFILWPFVLMKGSVDGLWGFLDASYICVCVFSLFFFYPDQGKWGELQKMWERRNVCMHTYTASTHCFFHFWSSCAQHCAIFLTPALLCECALAFVCFVSKCLEKEKSTAALIKGCGCKSVSIKRKLATCVSKGMQREKESVHWSCWRY